MSEVTDKLAVPLKPARKQVKPGQVEKKETPQTGKEYSKLLATIARRHQLTELLADIWYNKWAGGDREDSYSKYVQLHLSHVKSNLLLARKSPRHAAISSAMRATREPTRLA